MSNLAPLIAAWDEGHRELAISLSDFPDQDLWKRPNPKLLSAGELAGHIAYWQAVWVGAEGKDRPELDSLSIKSPLINHAFRYYTTNVETAVALNLSSQQVLEELMRVHNEVKSVVQSKQIDEPYPGQWRTWGNLVQYQVFHVAYHTGQIYSVRHLLGHATEDN